VKKGHLGRERLLPSLCNLARPNAKRLGGSLSLPCNSKISNRTKLICAWHNRCFRPIVSKPVIRLAVSGLWLLAVAASGLLLIAYENTAGPQSRVHDTFPTLAAIQLDTHRNTLLMFAHPKCPCTRASINELNRLLAHCSTNVDAHVFFLQPKSVEADWVKTDLWRSAANIAGVQTHVDPDGAIAARFGASTSGYVVLYNAQGKLLFHGGITSGRGHEGDNPGSSALLALATGTGANVACNKTPVYGCLLQKDCLAPTQEIAQ
jgi:hypothetical protein